MTVTPNESNCEPDTVLPRDAAYWAREFSSLQIERTPTGALNLNVQGRLPISPLQGFGQMWDKTYRVRLQGSEVQPAEVIKVWKENFAQFWPEGNRFFAPLSGITPGEVGLINMRIPGDLPVGLPLSTGVLVLYADDVSFTFMTPPGHVFAGWITFSAYEEDTCTIAQIQVLMRTCDPVYEIGFRLGASRAEDIFWQRTLTSLAARFGVQNEPVLLSRNCLDPKVQWAYFWNIWQNATIRTTVYRLLSPALHIRKKSSRIARRATAE